MKSYWTKRNWKLATIVPVVAGTLSLSGCIVERQRPVYYQEQPQPVYVQEQPAPPPPTYVQAAPPPPGYVEVDPPPGAVVITEAPPPDRYDPQPPPPGPDFIWVTGFWVRESGTWIWQRGHWDRPPRPGLRYEPDHWQRVRGGYVRVQGGWR
jgi:hypothetical protein